MNQKNNSRENCENICSRKGVSNTIYNNKNSTEEKFRNAQEKLQAAVQKHLEEQEYESSSDEETLESESILNDVFKNYSQFNKEHEGTERTQQFLENAFQSGSGVCLICIASIKRADPIWSCIECYGYFHLNCIQKWSKDSIQQQKFAQNDLPAFKKINKFLWACPKCRKDYSQDEVPQRYHCFCGKVEDPQHHPWLVPHSCGETCNKLLKPKCGHSCLLLCHPGPCPPCPKTVQSYCYCKKQGPKHQRCSNKLWSCNAKCNKPLLCKKHFCEESCHSGDCQPCKKESLQKCKCGLEERKQPCFNPNWQCQKICGKPYSCGFHKCLMVCHDGFCGECPLSLERTCPCGKTSAILPCTSEIPTCKDTCNKLLECGIHRCSQKCHKDKCGKCLEIVTKVCRCGSHKKELPCQKEFICETKCKQLKNCLKHSCNRKCCDLNCPPCEKPCGKTLKCGYHKCSSVCHRGQCYPCPLVAEVKCKCGKTVVTVPCGRQKKTQPPKCNKLCLIPPTCHHDSREQHFCHFGECPPCKQICMKERSSCSHNCSAPCHSSVLVKIANDHHPSGFWEMVEPKLKRCNLPCPECEVPVLVTCLGGHETINRPCHKAQPTSCQRLCGRKLKCGNHTCNKMCHTIIGSGDNINAGENCIECDSKCLKERPPGCTHPCSKPCHPGLCPPCNLNVKVKCHCGISTLYFHCFELNTANYDAKIALLSCGNNCPKEYPCGHKCKENCHFGDCPDPNSCKKKMKITCKCGRIKKTTCDVVRENNKTVFECDKYCSVKNQEEKIRISRVKMDNKDKKEEDEENDSENLRELILQQLANLEQSDVSDDDSYKVRLSCILEDDESESSGAAHKECIKEVEKRIKKNKESEKGPPDYDVRLSGGSACDSELSDDFACDSVQITDLDLVTIEDPSQGKVEVLDTIEKTDETLSEENDDDLKKDGFAIKKLKSSDNVHSRPFIIRRRKLSSDSSDLDTSLTNSGEGPSKDFKIEEMCENTLISAPEIVNVESETSADEDLDQTLREPMEIEVVDNETLLSIFAKVSKTYLEKTKANVKWEETEKVDERLFVEATQERARSRERDMSGEHMSLQDAHIRGTSPKEYNPPVPPETYLWEELKRLRERGGYPWTYLDKPPFDEATWKKYMEHVYEPINPPR